MLATVLAFHRHIIYTLAVAIVCCPVSLVAQCRLSPWTAVALLAVDAAGAHLNRANKRLSSEAAFDSDAEPISLESSVVVGGWWWHETAQSITSVRACTYHCTPHIHCCMCT